MSYTSYFSGDNNDDECERSDEQSLPMHCRLGQLGCCSHRSWRAASFRIHFGLDQRLLGSMHIQ